jgi:SAM-dependent methyltransferase
VTDSKVTDFYDEAYFKRQSQDGLIQGKANAFMFEPFIKPTDNVLDFGCGGGFLLASLPGRSRIGVEINEHAAANARQMGLDRVLSRTEDAPSDWADVVMSSHALEHVEEPMATLRDLKRILRPGGVMIIVTPYDAVSMAYSDNDPDRHLFGWSPSNLGNLARAAGLTVLEAKEIKHRWPPGWAFIWKTFGPTIFHFTAKLCARIRRNRMQIRLVARKPV